MSKYICLIRRVDQRFCCTRIAIKSNSLVKEFIVITVVLKGRMIITVNFPSNWKEEA